MSRILLFLIIPMYMVSCSLPARYNKKKSDTNKTVLSASISSENYGLMAVIDEWLGTPYKYGGNSRQGIDCSGFTALLMEEVYNLKIPRTAHAQYNSGGHLRRGDLRVGDLVFFRDIRNRGIDHVGIYIGDNRFAHATESAGVVISDLAEDYYDQRFSGARRFINE